MQLHECQSCASGVHAVRPEGTCREDVRCHECGSPMDCITDGQCLCGRGPATETYASCDRCCRACLDEWIDRGYLYPAPEDFLTHDL